MKKMIKSEETSFTKFSQKTDITLFIATIVNAESYKKW
jgi:hypothetical protein